MLQKNRTQKSPLQQPRAIAIVPLYLRSVLAPGAKGTGCTRLLQKKGGQSRLILILFPMTVPNTLLSNLVACFAKTALTVLIVIYCIEKVLLAEIRPQLVTEIKLGICHLPKKEIAYP